MMPPPDTTAPHPSPSGRQRRPTRVLVVEDDDAPREFMASELKLAGFAVAEASNGEEALQEVARFEPDAIVLDMMLPRLSGYTLARAVRTQESPRHVAIVAVSGLASEALHRQAIGAGCDVFLTKPVRAGLVVEHVTQLLAAQPSARTSGEDP
jgi:two-component system phosphate regulon response regulator PhoB